MTAIRLSVPGSYALALLLFASSPVVSAAQSPSAAENAAWLTSDSVARTISLRLEVTRPPGSASALINGQRAGGIQVIAPLNWTLKWEWRNLDSASTHSLVVMAEREKIPMEGGRPAFDNAMTRLVGAGLAAGQTDQTSFTADQAGWYWLLCGVPSHALEGEYIGLRVDPEATAGGVKTK